MKFPTLSRAKPAAPNAVGVSPSASATDSHLSNHSTLLEDPEKKEVQATSPTASGESRLGSENEDVALEKAKSLEPASDEPEYPSGVKLTIITLSLCISVFCMALVRRQSQSHIRHGNSLSKF